MEKIPTNQNPSYTEGQPFSYACILTSSKHVIHVCRVDCMDISSGSGEGNIKDMEVPFKKNC